MRFARDMASKAAKDAIASGRGVCVYNVAAGQISCVATWDSHDHVLAVEWRLSGALIDSDFARFQIGLHIKALCSRA